MNSVIQKAFIDIIFLCKPFYHAYTSLADSEAVRNWIRNGRPLPPPPKIKRDVIKQFQKRFRYKIFIETGTYLGGTVYALKDVFEKIYSIELSNALHAKTKALFAKYPNISLIQGSSADKLPLLIQEIDDPCIFWLDGHYSAGNTARGLETTPILAELSTILAHRVTGHVILIDDARLFTGLDGYPTVECIKSLAEAHAACSRFEIDSDIIRIY